MLPTSLCDAFFPLPFRLFPLLCPVFALAPLLLPLSLASPSLFWIWLGSWIRLVKARSTIPCQTQVDSRFSTCLFGSIRVHHHLLRRFPATTLTGGSPAEDVSILWFVWLCLAFVSFFRCISLSSFFLVCCLPVFGLWMRTISWFLSREG
jgi:hypothetical protein